VDQQAALFGHGCRKPGDAKITFGTGAFALAVTGNTLHHAPRAGLLPTIAWQQTGQPATYALDGGIYCAGSAINWGRSLGLFSQFSEIEQFQNPAACERKLMFIPALAGLGCPHWDRSAAGLWLGLSLETTAADMMQSMLEGIALRTHEVVSALAQELHLSDSISIDGGLSSNGYFCQFLSDTLQKELTTPSNPELTASGAALMAAGRFTSSPKPAVKVYTPRRVRVEAVDLFQKALSRSRGW